MTNLDQIISLGARRRTARVQYLKPGQQLPTLRIVEPYSIRYSQSAPGAVCWQISPEITTEPAWRTFRADRMVSVEDGGSTFTPRIKITVSSPNHCPDDDNPDPKPSPTHNYFLWLERALLDHRLTDDELTRALDLATSLPRHELRGVHGRIYADVLSEVLADGIITDAEESYLDHVRSSLTKLGYRP